MRLRRSCRRWSAAGSRPKRAGSGWRSCRSRRAAAPMMASLFFCSSAWQRGAQPSPSIVWPRTRCGAGRRGTAAIRMRARQRNTRPAALPSPYGGGLGRAYSLSAKRGRCRRPGGSRGPRAPRVRALVGEVLLEPVGEAVALAADRLNRFQFLTIRRYLSLVFAALVLLLLALATWP